MVSKSTQNLTENNLSIGLPQTLTAEQLNVNKKNQQPPLLEALNLKTFSSQLLDAC